MWVLRGLRNGVLTTHWPRRRDSYADGLRGPARVVAQPPGSEAGLPELCPSGAISYSPGDGLRLDQGQCIQCSRCVAQRPDLFAWSQGPAVASLTHAGLVTPQANESDEELARLRADLHQRTRALGRSVHIRHVDAGSDGSEEWEVLALLNPVYDVHRLGIFFTASPRHADILLVTGAGAASMTAPLRRTYDAMPEPKVVIAAGTDAVSGGLVSPSYATRGGVGDAVPVDVWVPGSPPSPFQLLHALLLGLGRLPGNGTEVTK
jgi:Ni,Fe-hydrogenase III small subunit/ferredoxin